MIARIVLLLKLSVYEKIVIAEAVAVTRTGLIFMRYVHVVLCNQFVENDHVHN